MDDPEWLSDAILDLEAAGDPLVVELADLEAEDVVQRLSWEAVGRWCIFGHGRQAIVPARMASYDQLSAQQRAIVDLILKRGQSYDQLADTLGMPENRVRELARDALTSLAPVSAAAVDDGWRAQIADYLLGQQAAPEAASTRGHLRRSETARAWSGSVLDSLEHLYPKGELPTIPSGDSAPEPKAKAEKPPKERKPSTPRAPLTPEAAAIVRRRRIAGVAAGAVALLFILLVWPVGLLTGGGDDSADAVGGPCGEGSNAGSVGQVVLEPVKRGANAAAVAQVTNTGGKCEVRIVAKLPRTRDGQAYEVWLANSPEDARSLGAQVTDKSGNFAGAAPFPANYKSYRYLEITREKVDRNAANSGNPIVRAETAAIRQQQGTGTGSSQGTGTTPAP
jgi:Anti-sigma-K factor rskA/Sigma-70, region 4